jgi:hypothetical protein
MLDRLQDGSFFAMQEELARQQSAVERSLAEDFP